jgi:hypothetical protein
MHTPSPPLTSSRLHLLTMPCQASTIANPDHPEHPPLKHNKWGWLIYRSTYDDDEAWTRLKQTLTQQSRHIIAASDTPELADSQE